MRRLAQVEESEGSARFNRDEEMRRWLNTLTRDTDGLLWGSEQSSGEVEG